MKKLKPIVLSVSIGETTYYPTPPAQEEIDGLHDKIGPGRGSHEQLFKIVTHLPTDFEPYGKRKREGYPDCSCGCNFYHTIEGEQGADWGLCWNPKSPRKGLLTFEHMGCPKFAEDPRFAQIDKEELRILRKDKKAQKKKC